LSLRFFLLHCFYPFLPFPLERKTATTSHPPQFEYPVFSSRFKNLLPIHVRWTNPLLFPPDLIGDCCLSLPREVFPPNDSFLFFRLFGTRTLYNVGVIPPENSFPPPLAFPLRVRPCFFQFNFYSQKQFCGIPSQTVLINPPVFACLVFSPKMWFFLRASCPD